MTYQMKAVMLRNRLTKKLTGVPLTFHVRNNYVNGQARGCSGHVRNDVNGNIVYIDTEASVYSPLADKVLWRYAKAMDDYTGERNQWSSHQKDAFIDDIANALTKNK